MTINWRGTTETSDVGCVFAIFCGMCGPVIHLDEEVTGRNLSKPLRQHQCR